MHNLAHAAMFFQMERHQLVEFDLRVSADARDYHQLRTRLRYLIEEAFTHAPKRVGRDAQPADIFWNLRGWPRGRVFFRQDRDRLDARETETLDHPQKGTLSCNIDQAQGRGLV